MKDIIVYRVLISDMVKIFNEIADRLRMLNISAEIDDEKLFIYVYEYRIQFWCGDAAKMGGLRPSYYNTNSRRASDYLAQSASKCNGKEVKRIRDIYKIVCKNNL